MQGSVAVAIFTGKSGHFCLTTGFTETKTWETL